MKPSQHQLEKFFEYEERKAKKIYEEWEKAQDGTPPPFGMFRFFKIRMKDFKEKRMLDLTKVQNEVRRWAAHNFPFHPSYHPLLGMQEELGELSHAHLKLEQKIRTGENLFAERKDAIGDLVIYLLDYCSCHGLILEEIIKETWEKVSQRDWRANPETGEALPQKTFGRVPNEAPPSES